MNAGLGNLTELKAHLLAEALRGGTKYDTALLAIGQGTAALLEKFCNRKFLRTANATFDISADRDHCYLDRYPVESVASVAKRSDPTTGFETLTDAIVNWDAASGLVHFGGRQGLYWETLRITFTGGYWFDITEDSSDSLPDGATQLPADLKLAWLTQCRLNWQSIDKLGVDILKTGTGNQAPASSVAGLTLSDHVKEMIAGYRRFQIT